MAHLIKYTPAKKGTTIEIRTLQCGRLGKIGEIKKQRGAFRAKLTRHADLPELDAISRRVMELNGKAA